MFYPQFVVLSKQLFLNITHMFILLKCFRNCSVYYIHYVFPTQFFLQPNTIK